MKNEQDLLAQLYKTFLAQNDTSKRDEVINRIGPSKHWHDPFPQSKWNEKFPEIEKPTGKSKIFSLIGEGNHISVNPRGQIWLSLNDEPMKEISESEAKLLISSLL